MHKNNHHFLYIVQGEIILIKMQNGMKITENYKTEAKNDSDFFSKNKKGLKPSLFLQINYIKLILWLPDQDSNPDKMSQSHLCYPYTIRQYNGASSGTWTHTP